MEQGAVCEIVVGGVWDDGAHRWRSELLDMLPDGRRQEGFLGQDEEGRGRRSSSLAMAEKASRRQSIHVEAGVEGLIRTASLERGQPTVGMAEDANALQVGPFKESTKRVIA